MKNHNLSYFVSVWLLIFVLFASVAFGVVFQSLGYKFNSQTKRVELTGMILIKTVPKDADVYIDNKKLNQTTPLRLTKLLPNAYSVRISKNGYIDWEEVVNVESGKASIIEDVYLFYVNRANLEISSDDERQFDKKIENNIQIINRLEIYIKRGLDLIFVTRFSEEVISAQSIINNKYVMYQVGDKVFISDLTGQNILPVLTLQNTETADLRIIGDDIVLVRQGSKLSKIKIR